MLRRILVVIVILLSVNYMPANRPANGLVNGTDGWPANDYKKVDEYARSVRKTGDYKMMAKKLTAPFATQQEKVRSVFIWITHNIRYDYRKFKSNQRRGGYRIKGRSKREIALKRKKIKYNKVLSTYRTGKGVCEDYSYLFQAMCKSVGIDAGYITGITKTNPDQIGQFPRYSLHAWNSVKINGKWYLLDATWAAGTVDHRTGRYKRDYHEGYFLTSPEIFILNHYPDNKKWQLLSKPVTKLQFKNFAFPHGEFFASNDIYDFYPKSGFLSRKNQYAIVKIKYKGKVPNIVILRKGKMVKPDYNIRNNEMAIKVPTRHSRNVILGIKKGRRFDHLLEYKIR